MPDCRPTYFRNCRTRQDREKSEILNLKSEIRNPKSETGRGKWLALAAALLGWMFDGMEMGIFSMVGRPALRDLLASPGEDRVGRWLGVIMACFLVGAATGGVLFGWLGDRIGRVRAMTLSVLVYSLFTGACGFAAEAWQLGVLRFIAALGMGGEWSLGVALVMEVWPNRSRAFMAGLIGAAANVGYMLVGFIGLGFSAVQQALADALNNTGLSAETIQWLTAHQGWRIIMIIGVAPALLTLFICIFVPESKRWAEERARGGTTGWQSRDLFGVLVGSLGGLLIVYVWAWDGPDWLPNSLRVRIIGSVLGLLVALFGYTFPLVRYLQRQGDAEGRNGTWTPTFRRMLLAACLSGVPLLVTWAAAQWLPAWADQLTDGDRAQQAKEYSQIYTAFGAVVGTILAALAGDWIGRRPTYCLLCVLSLASVVLQFQFNREYGPRFLASGFVLGASTASFYGWLPLYLPELFPTRVRATCTGFGYNFGRIIAAVGVLQTGNLMGLFQEDVVFLGRTFSGGYPLACTVMGLVYVVGVFLIWLAPETRGKPLPE
jgi:MFS family permease